MDVVQKRSPVPSSEGYLGDMVAWTFGDATQGTEFSANRIKVSRIFDDLGFDSKEMLDGGDPGKMLARAPNSGGIHFGRGHFWKQLARPNKDTPLALGVYLRSATNGEAGDEWAPGARVRINGSGFAQALPPEGSNGDASCLEIADKIALRANHLVDNVCNQELSGALVRAGYECGWAQFRRGTGGAYWVPSYGAERFRNLLDALERFGGFWPIVQPLFGDSEGRTASNVKAAALAALEAELAQVSEDLEKAEAGDLRKSSVEARVDRCREIFNRANLYAEALRGSLEAVVERIEGVSARYGKLLDMRSDLSAFDQAVGQ